MGNYMKVAIIGAGVSGLSCAYELERNGIVPAIFEKRSQIGDPAGYSAISIRIMTRSLLDPFKTIEKKYGLKINPMSPLKEISMISPKSKAIIKGNIGCIFKRGIENNSLENQIGAFVKTQIHFDSYIEINNIINSFDNIIVATSQPVITKQFKIWSETYAAQARLGLVIGDFKPDSATIWFNINYAKNGFAYLIPNSTKEATLTLVVNGCTPSELDYYWDNFIKAENIKFQIIQISDIEHYCGFVNPLKVGNVYFVGNAGGFTDDLIGVGAINAIESGILAATAIIKGKDYDKLMQPISRDVKKLHEYRKMINCFDNSQLDILISFLNSPVIKQIVYNNPFMRIQKGASILKLLNNIMDNKY